MTIIDSVILGIVEGVSEFLPISSTGHLILAGTLLHLPSSDFLKSFEIVIQLGAILAVVALYWRSFLDAERLKKIIVAFLPTGVIGLALYSFIKTYLLGNDAVVLASLFLGGVFLIGFEYWHREKESAGTLEQITYKQALIIGLCQAVAVIPGVSRSAATIVGGLSLNLRRTAIVEFSFLLAVPTMAAATGLDLVKNVGTFSSADALSLGIGFIVSFIVALVSIKFLLGYIRAHTFTAFGFYRIAAAAAFWLLILK